MYQMFLAKCSQSNVGAEDCEANERSESQRRSWTGSEKPLKQVTLAGKLLKDIRADWPRHLIGL